MTISRSSQMSVSKRFDLATAKRNADAEKHVRTDTGSQGRRRQFDKVDTPRRPFKP